jgi:hypothetical protein
MKLNDKKRKRNERKMMQKKTSFAKKGKEKIVCIQKEGNDVCYYCFEAKREKYEAKCKVDETKSGEKFIPFISPSVD